MIGLTLLALTAVACSMLPIASPPTPPPLPTDEPTPIPSDFAITGVIANSDETTEYLTEDSYLTLVPMPENGKLLVVFNSDGTVEIAPKLAQDPPDLPQIPVPSDGAFSLQAESLAPGEYLIAIQKYIPGKQNFKPMVLLLGGDENTFEVPEDVTLPFHLDVREVDVQLP
jgi:hypothetical protein